MQMMGLLIALFLARKVNLKDHPEAEKIHNILHALAFEHLFAYACDYFRKYDISNFGQLDMHGVYRGKRESYLQIVEIVMDCMIMGFSFNHISI